MNEKTLQRLKQMNFLGMATAFKTTLEDGRMASMTADEMVAFLVESEWDHRNNRRIERHSGPDSSFKLQWEENSVPQQGLGALLGWL